MEEPFLERGHLAKRFHMIQCRHQECQGLLLPVFPLAKPEDRILVSSVDHEVESSQPFDREDLAVPDRFHRPMRLHHPGMPGKRPWHPRVPREGRTPDRHSAAHEIGGWRDLRTLPGTLRTW